MARFENVFLRFSESAIAIIAAYEKKIQELVLTNITAFNLSDKEHIPEVYDRLKDDIYQAAIITCESSTEINEAEFALYMLKFAANPRIYVHLEYLEYRIGQLLEFNDVLRNSNDPLVCPFMRYILEFQKPKE